MVRMINRNKEKIISEFEMMKDLELGAKSLYIKIAASPDVKEQRIKDIFAKIAEEEQRHADIVQKIINIATSAL
ncbi:MAG: ferritin family protein [Sedimentisphaerales bacterium]